MADRRAGVKRAFRPWMGALLLLGGLALAAPLLAEGLAAGPWQRLTQAGAGLVLAAAAGLMSSHAARALRLHAEWQPRCGVRLAECLRVSLLHSVAINLLPLRSGELGFPLLVATRWGVRPADAAASLVWMRLQDMVVLAWLTVLSGLAVACGAGGLPLGLAVLSALGVTAALLWAAGCAGSRTPEPRDAGANRHAQAATRPWRARLQAAAAAWGRARRAATPWTWACCTANWVCKLFTLGALLAALLEQRTLAGWCGSLAGEFAAALPVQATAGFGTYEAAVALGLRLAGAAPPLPAALAAAFVVHLLLLAVTLGAAALALLHDLWRRRGGVPAVDASQAHKA